jgi:carbon-monoxide dehydrogenase small subunit
MERRIKLDVNGRLYEITADTRTTLVKALRETLGLTGTKCGCERGECGSCTVLMNGMAVNSCLVLALEAEGFKIVTIESLAQDGTLHVLQENFIKNGAIQCGFCTPGMIMTAKASLDKNPRPTEREVRQALSGNYCRCTGYEKIVKSVLLSSHE